MWIALLLPPWSHRQTKRVIDQQAVIDTSSLGKLEDAAHPAEYVVIGPDLMQLGLGPVEQHLDDGIVGPRPYARVLIPAKDLQVADDVPQIARREHRGLIECKRAIAYHPLA